MKSYLLQTRLLGESDFIDVARETLNRTALYHKQKELPNTAKEKFITRDKNFFHAFSGVNFAKRGQAKHLDGLYSESGIFANKKDKSGANVAENLSIQEDGGAIQRDVVPLNRSRVSGAYNRKVQRKSLFKSSVNAMTTQSEMKGVNARQRMVIALRIAEKQNEDFVLTDEFRAIYKRFGGRWAQVYKFYKGNKNTIKGVHLFKDSGQRAMETIPERFIEAAQDKIKFRAKRIRSEKINYRVR